MSDEKLFRLCKYYGEQARVWRQKFCGLLPEVNRRRLYEKKGFGSIFEFAKKLAGLSEEQVRRVLNLERKFESTPVLKKMLVNGETSVNKLARIASIATPENQEILAEQVKLLSSRALETLARDERTATIDEQIATAGPHNQNGFQEPYFGNKSVHVHTQMPQLDDDVKTRLNELQNKGIDINELLRKFLDVREEEIENEKQELSEKELMRVNKTMADGSKPTRYISVKIRNLIKKEHGTKCAVPICQKPSEHNHHTNRFSLSKNHDPRFLAPLCTEHHTIAHTIDLAYHEVRRLNQ